MAKGGKAKGPGDHLEVNEEQSTADITETTNQIKTADESNYHAPNHSSNPSSGIKSGVGRKRIMLEDDLVATELTNVSKSIRSLAEVETGNTATLNATQAAFLQEIEVQKKLDERRNKLFPELKKISTFSQQQIVKAALIIGQDASVKSFL